MANRIIHDQWVTVEDWYGVHKYGLIACCCRLEVDGHIYKAHHIAQRGQEEYCKIMASGKCVRKLMDNLHINYVN